MTGACGPIETSPGARPLLRGKAQLRTHLALTICRFVSFDVGTCRMSESVARWEASCST